MKQFTLLITLFFGFTIFAQSTEFTIKGKIIDSKTKQPLPYVTVTLMSSVQKIKEVSSDENGNYVLKSIPEIII